jgi:CRP/FNR family transcriptional regulator
MTTSDLHTLLDVRYPLLEDALIEAIGNSGIYKEFPADTVLMKRGQYIKSTMLILSGLVKVYREDEEGNEFLMYYLQPGEACALSMVCAARHEESPIMAKTVQDTSAIMIPVEIMSNWMSQYKSWYQFVVETYRTRFEELLHTIDSIAFKNMDERLESYLQKAVEIGGSSIIHLSHQDIARELNSSREVISRLLKKMEQMGKVVLSRNSIEVKIKQVL